MVPFMVFLLTRYFLGLVLPTLVVTHFLRKKHYQSLLYLLILQPYLALLVGFALVRRTKKSLLNRLVLFFAWLMFSVFLWVLFLFAPHHHYQYGYLTVDDGKKTYTVVYVEHKER